MPYYFRVVGRRALRPSERLPALVRSEGDQGPGKLVDVARRAAPGCIYSIVPGHYLSLPWCITKRRRRMVNVAVQVYLFIWHNRLSSMTAAYMCTLLATSPAHVTMNVRTLTSITSRSTDSHATGRRTCSHLSRDRRRARDPIRDTCPAPALSLMTGTSIASSALYVERTGKEQRDGCWLGRRLLEVAWH